MTSDRPAVRPLRRTAAAFVLAAGLAAAAIAAPSDDMRAFDARFVPALMSTNVAQPDAAATARATAAVQRLAADWPALRARLAAAGRAVAADRAGWERMLVTVDRGVAQAEALLRQGRVQAAHEALEPVRPAMLAARRAAGIDDPVDRLVEFHDRMETLVAAAPAAREGRLSPVQRDALVREFAHARALWSTVERTPAGLPPERVAAFERALAEESAALSRLSDALRDGDGATLATALAALKPPFARAYGAYGDAR